MNKGDILTMLQADLDLLHVDDKRQVYLDSLIEAAISFIAREGVKLTEPYSYEDGTLIVMYAAYLFRKRAVNEPMPRSLRWALNNRIFGGKAHESE